MLSRTPLKVGAVVMSLEPFGPKVYSNRYVEDNDFKHAYQRLKEDCDIVDGHHLEDDLLYKDGKLCVPKDSRLKLIREAHTSLLAGHFGVLKMVANLQRRSTPHVELPSAPESLVELPQALESLVELPQAPESFVELPPTPESFVELSPAHESPVELPSALESVVEPPLAPEPLVEIPLAPESLVELPKDPESLVELPQAPESFVELPPTPESFVELPPALESPVELPSAPKSVGEPPPALEPLVEISLALESLVEIPPVPESFVELPPSVAKMKHIIKIMTLLMAISAFWIGLLEMSVVPHSYTWLLPVYFIVSLGCYGLLMVGVGLMRFPTCPHEAWLLHQDVAEAREFLKQRGVDVACD
ncbi:hypothetical protein HHK36_021140 [Tetracentron sinense]|uniref:Integrase zinc-binding domain-containing protein n=1 Tax=Tetracentron sinense TaxID=13715 RepID=A0A834YRJ2_TETSI|nr:hypothetical protein HHK36_021140 [Tetracentron sinense]